VVYGREYSMGGTVSRWSLFALCATAVCSESVYSWLDALQVARTLTCIGGNTVSTGVEDLCKLSRWSQSALCTTVACSDSLWFDPVERTRTLSCLQCIAIFPGVEEPCGRGGAYGMGGKVTWWSQSSTVCQCSVLRKGVFMA